MQERLLERLRRIEADPEHRGVTDPNRLIHSIMLHLQRVLNTRQGSALIDDDYGVPDFTDLAANFSQETVRDLTRAIRQVINKYEPRLTGVQVIPDQLEKNLLELTLKIEGRLQVAPNQDVPVAFETLVDPDGKISVKR